MAHTRFGCAPDSVHLCLRDAVCVRTGGMIREVFIDCPLETTAASFNFSAPLSTRPITSTRSSSRLLMLVRFNQTSWGWRSQSKGTFLSSP
jgi:hypothetical protein